MAGRGAPLKRDGGERLSLSGVARMFGITTNTVRAWVKSGMPYLTAGDNSRGIDWEFDSAHVIKWREDQVTQTTAGTGEATLSELQRRKLAAETEVAEINAAKARGEVVAVEDVERVISADYITIKQAIRQIPARLAPLLVGQTDQRAVKDLLEDELNQALERLANEFFDGEEETNSEAEPA